MEITVTIEFEHLNQIQNWLEVELNKHCNKKAPADGPETPLGQFIINILDQLPEDSEVPDLKGFPTAQLNTLQNAINYLDDKNEDFSPQELFTQHRLLESINAELLVRQQRKNTVNSYPANKKTERIDQTTTKA